MKKFDINTSEIEISTEGLDEIILETSEDNQVTILLDDENSLTKNVFVNDEQSFLKIKFLSEVVQKEGVFRKFITKRLNRATAKIQIPKDKKVVFLGKEVDIVSKSYQGDISIFIDKGEIKLAKVNGNVVVKLYSGNIYATALNADIDIKSTIGNIVINGKRHQSEFKKTLQKTTQKFTVKSIKANIVLSTLKTQ